MVLSFVLNSRSFNSVLTMEGTSLISNYLRSSEYLVVHRVTSFASSNLLFTEIYFYDEDVLLSGPCSTLILPYQEFFIFLKFKSVSYHNTRYSIL